MQQGSDAARTHRPAGRCVRQPQAPRPQDSSTAVHFRENAVHFHEHAHARQGRMGRERALRHRPFPARVGPICGAVDGWTTLAPDSRPRRARLPQWPSAQASSSSYGSHMTQPMVEAGRKTGTSKPPTAGFRFNSNVDRKVKTEAIPIRRVEVITGVERRRDWTDEQKLSIIAESSRDGVVISDVARRHGLRPQQLFNVAI